MSKQKIGVIGVGLMGHGIAKNILKGGWPVSFLDHPGNQPVDDLVAAGAARFESATELAKASDVIILCVTGSPQVEDILTGSGRVLAALVAGQVVIDCSTAIPSSTQRMAAQVAEAGAQFIDAAMTRTPKEAEEGRLNLLIGCAPDLYAKLEPLFEAFSENRFLAGPVGSGHTLKLLHNFCSIGMATLIGEAAACAATAGMDPAILVDCLKRGGGYGAALDRMGPYILDGDLSSMQFSNANAHKDVGYYNRMAEDLGAKRNVAGGLLGALDWLIENGHADKYVPEQVHLFRNDT